MWRENETKEMWRDEEVMWVGFRQSESVENMNKTGKEKGERDGLVEFRVLTPGRANLFFKVRLSTQQNLSSTLSSCLTPILSIQWLT